MGSSNAIILRGYENREVVRAGSVSKGRKRTGKEASKGSYGKGVEEEGSFGGIELGRRVDEDGGRHNSNNRNSNRNSRNSRRTIQEGRLEFPSKSIVKDCVYENK